MSEFRGHAALLRISQGIDQRIIRCVESENMFSVFFVDADGPVEKISDNLYIVLPGIVFSYR